MSQQPVPAALVAVVRRVHRELLDAGFGDDLDPAATEALAQLNAWLYRNDPTYSASNEENR